MFKKVRVKSFFVGFLSLMLAAGFIAGLDHSASAYSKTQNVSNEDEFQSALADPAVDHIVITQSFAVDCPMATTGNTSYFVVDRSMTIEGKTSDITITRAAASKNDNKYLQSLVGIHGNGKEGVDGEFVEVTLANLTLDGGAVFGEYTGYDRCDQYSKIIDMGAAGRSLVDVYGYGILNLENNLTIQNSICTYSLASCTSDSGSWCFGGGVRVDFETGSGGGTVNVKAGSTIKNCVASNANGKSYGGALGAYTHARLNVYGGTIEDCSAYYGGAVGCTYRSGSNSSEAGTFRMYGGLIRNCSAREGGAICVQGKNPDPNCLLGGTIDNCTAVDYGGSVKLSGDKNYVPPFSITPYSVNGPLSITNCSSNNEEEDSSTVQDVAALKGYSGLNLGEGGATSTTVEGKTCTISFKKKIDDTDDYAVLTIKEGTSLGESFPADPVWGDAYDYTFIEWNLLPGGNDETIVDKEYVFVEDSTVYARWLCPPEYTLSGDMNITYGDEDKIVEIKDAASPYGGTVSYNWGYRDSDGTAFDVGGTIDDSTCKIPQLPVGKYSFFCQLVNSVLIQDETGYGSKSINRTSKPINIDVAPKTLDITWSDTEFVCDGKNKLPKAVLNGVLDGDDVGVKVIGAKSEAGTYTATAVLTGDDAGNYVIAEGKDTCSFTISPVIKMPYLTGKNYQKAMTELEKFLKDNGLKATITYGWAHNSDPAKNLTVAQTTPASGEPVNDVDTIILMVYEGYNPTISLNKNAANVVCGDKLTLKATMSGASSAISWKSSDTKIATVDKNGKVTAKMAGAVTITATSLGVSAKCDVMVLYKDVTNKDDFWYAPTNYLTAKGVVKGYANQTEFRPANDCTRAQMITFLYRLQGEPKTKSTTCKFTDVKSTDYFYKPVIWAVEQGITTVPSDKKFNPQTVCTRAMTVTFLWRMAGKPEPKTTKNPFPDVKKADYFYKATLWASEMKILAGLPDGTFQPQGKCLRRQMVTFLYKYDKYVNGKG